MRRVLPQKSSHQLLKQFNAHKIPVLVRRQRDADWLRVEISPDRATRSWRISTA